MASDAATLTLRNQQLEQETQTLVRQLTEVKEEVKRSDNASTQTSTNHQAAIDKLKREVEAARRDAETQASERERQRPEGEEMKR
jgi:hypothetical protein